MGVVKDGFGENGGRYQGVKVKRYVMVYGVNPRKKPTPSQAGLGFEPPTPRIESELATSLATVPSLQIVDDAKFLHGLTFVKKIAERNYRFF
jgi:hypothetical protein